MKLGLVWGLSVLWLGALSLGACGDDATSGDGSGGDSAGTAGTRAGTGGSSAGAGGDQGGAAGNGGAGCGSRTLADYCGNGKCPKSPSDVELTCGDPEHSTVRRTSSCGGVSIVRSFGLVSRLHDLSNKSRTENSRDTRRALGSGRKPGKQLLPRRH
jgi:hypothetical protein